MRRTGVLTVLLAVAITFAAGAAVQAGPMREGGQGHGREGRGFIGLRELVQLGLSKEQKLSIYDILQKYQAEQENLRDSIQQSRAALDSLASAEEFNEAAIRQAFKEKSAVMEEALVLRARQAAEIKAVLTAGQLAAMKENRPGRREARQGPHESRQARLEAWLQADDE